MADTIAPLSEFSTPIKFGKPTWQSIPYQPGVYIIYDRDEIIYVGMAGRDKNGSLRRRLKDHSTGQVVNMFAQYLFLARVQFLYQDRITHPVAAKTACKKYIEEHCVFRYKVTSGSIEARDLESKLKVLLKPSLNFGRKSAA